MIFGFSDILKAYDEGRYWRCDWQKVTGITAYTAGMWYDLSLLPGTPRQNIYPGGMLTATKLDYKSSGAIWHGSNVNPYTKYIVKVGAYNTISTGAPIVFVIADYLLFYPLIDLDYDQEQELDNSVSLPRYENGEGVMAFFVATSDVGVNAFDVSIKYTNSDGVEGCTTPFAIAGRTGAITGQLLTAGTSANNYGPFIPLASGDRGIRKIESITLSAGAGGGYGCLVLCKPLLFFPMNELYSPVERNMIFDIPNLPEVKDGAFLSFMIHSGAALAASSRLCGYLDFVWG